MKRLTAFLLLVLTVLMLALPVSANSPPANYTYVFYFENLPQGTAYVDLLIQLPADDPMYTELVRENLPDEIPETAPIVTYCQEDYRSFSLHYEGAVSAFRVSDDSSVTFFSRHGYDQMKDVIQRGDVKLAMVDAAGNILKVSCPMYLDSRSIFSDVIRQVHYDAGTDQAVVNTEYKPLSLFGFLLISIMGMALTCVVEWAVAWPFGLDKTQSGRILRTNLVSQTAMRIVDALIRGLVRFSYVYMVLILEVLVYTGEFLYYRRKMEGVSWKRCLLYTILANTASLLIGLWVFRFVLT